MKILEKINNLHPYISFNIFAFDGFFILFFLTLPYLTNGNGYFNGGTVFGGMLFILILLNLAFVVFLLEQAFEFKIKNKFFTQNKILKTLRYIGSIITIWFFLYILIFVV